MDEETLSEANEQTDCVPETPKRAFHLDNEQHQSTPSIVSRPCVQELDEDDELDEVNAVKSTQDEFASVRCIPETPPPRNSTTLEAVARIEEGENLDVDGRVIASKHQRTKRKRVEAILSSEEDEPTTSEGITNYLNVKENEVAQNTCPRRQQTDPPGSYHETKLKPLPRGAPRIIEKKGRYTIHRGIRIRDYKVPSPDSSYLPPPSSPEFQCRDGFDANETPLGYPRPMNSRVKEIGDLETTSLDLDRTIPGRERNQLSRSPSLGTAREG
ncbi:hypothetical protein LCI18_008231 [Fusarium solani-melongenae]|uniref:Uncharacterized protein n=1 Tax=Fusarium solani subsp. cucurbitae TaxID=2747967 RepID=A0ACD3Z8W8_FUSSC|nr:hypothetical protein LCI18_008231 [Fusarium solani-melongenae]